jgi:cation:H+ antiporter
MKAFWWWKILLAGALAVPAVALRLAGAGAPPLASVLVNGGAVVASAFLLCWAAEAVQHDISASLATALLALIAILPEYAVDLYFAFASGRHPALARFAAANMTGSNRLLLGLGWPVVLFCLLAWGRRVGVPVPELALRPGRRVELAYLGLASLVGLAFPLAGGIPWAGGLVLVGLYLLYAWRLAKEERREPELLGVAARLGALPWWRRRLALTALFLWSALVVALVAKPFANALVDGGRALGLDEFLLVQWVAPLATEAPEFLVAVLLALRGDADTSLGTLLSSKVNQWTLLVGGLPLAHLLGGGRAFLPFDPRQAEEFWLTSAQTLMGLALLAKLSLRRWEAAALVLLFAAQFPFPAPGTRLVLAGIYGCLALVLLARHRRALPPLVRALWRPGPLALPPALRPGPWPDPPPIDKSKPPAPGSGAARG